MSNLVEVEHIPSYKIFRFSGPKLDFDDHISTLCSDVCFSL